MSVTEYLAALPEERRAAITAVRKVIRKNLDRDYEEGIHYGMIGFVVPHRVFPKGYHCDPKKPLLFIGLGSQKNYMVLHLCALYMKEAEARWFKAAWAKSKKKLDMGKACLRFTSVDDLALDVIGETVARMPARDFVEVYEAGRTSRTKAATRKTSARSTTRSTKEGAGARAGARKTASKPATRTSR